MDRRLSTEADYCALLKRLWSLHMGYEQCLAVQDWSGTGIDFDGRRRAAALGEDLAAFGQSVTGLEPTAVSVTNTAESLGCLYVLEGSTLGGRLILQRAQTMLGVTADAGGRFFNGYGTRTGAMWRALTSAIDAISSSCEAEAVERGAMRTFGRFIAVLAR